MTRCQVKPFCDGNIGRSTTTTCAWKAQDCGLAPFLPAWTFDSGGSLSSRAGTNSLKAAAIRLARVAYHPRISNICKSCCSQNVQASEPLNGRLVPCPSPPSIPRLHRRRYGDPPALNSNRIRSSFLLIAYHEHIPPAGLMLCEAPSSRCCYLGRSTWV